MRKKLRVLKYFCALFQICDSSHFVVMLLHVWYLGKLSCIIGITIVITISIIISLLLFIIIYYISIIIIIMLVQRFDTTIDIHMLQA